MASNSAVIHHLEPAHLLPEVDLCDGEEHLVHLNQIQLLHPGLALHGGRGEQEWKGMGRKEGEGEGVGGWRCLWLEWRVVHLVRQSSARPQGHNSQEHQSNHLLNSADILVFLNQNKSENAVGCVEDSEKINIYF